MFFCVLCPLFCSRLDVFHSKYLTFPLSFLLLRHSLKEANKNVSSVAMKVGEAEDYLEPKNV